MHKSALAPMLLAAVLAAPLSAQDHDAHADHTAPQSEDPHAAHATPAPKAEAEPVDHCAMGHLPPEQCPPKSAANKHEGMDHVAMDHGTMDHGTMDHGAMDHSQMDHSAHGAMTDKSAPGAAPESAVPPRALEGPRHAADAVWGAETMAPVRRQIAREHGRMTTGMVLVERLEARLATDGTGSDGYLWDAQAWYGGDLDKLVVKTEGEGEFGGAVDDAEIQALYSRAIGPFFDLQAGIRFDPEPDSRTHAVLGLQGLAPYMFHVDAALFLSDRGDVTARVEAEYDQKITQSLILQPRIEAEFAAQGIPERGIGSGLTKIEPGLRLRYEIVREFAPYLGIEYEAKTGRTADIAKAAGDDPDGLKLVLGLRAWF